MALEATHIRFALDIENRYKIEDIKKYISGAIYPDSRYVTKIDRNLTHNENIILPKFAKDDFKKGWQAHQIGDIVQNKVKRKLFSDILGECSGCSEEEWIISTAIKIIQDISDMQKFDLQSYIKCLEYVENPNGEGIGKVKEYYKVIIDLYKNKKNTSIEDYCKMWLGLGISEELGEKVKVKTREFVNDKDMVKRIDAIYDEMIGLYKENY
ncbi:MAG: hypothetical protein CO137_02025 [Candidatus Magasanikbacteria bacterium CG_4_9_14_3_um_filter_32_9]|uniref:Phospholipase C/D domain-containing protein n=1 Tax=Candidatus Magasanikbacteria bacterium CG_4_9_14_3_um_filter_32_9 TaxID=1974644 RepID=A0A2M7Z6T3_9BACT|nr:MAG: hypothetical protein CO137_02025 [Candidatus Magasanikbacteria bacterium CG_4_9_14_3_um_filter_32_9]